MRGTITSIGLRPSGRTTVLVSIGSPVHQVKSPGNQNQLCSERGIDAVMIGMDVGAEGLDHAVNLLRHWGNCAGFVVTIPHKQSVTRLIDELSQRAADLGAVNVVRRTDAGRLIGDNFDG